ncbi:MAG: hypothetical protein VYB81_04305 [Pseudomonadota bacterium]|nr:hypothetical protein [Pseudomonadota bacterium]
MSIKAKLFLSTLALSSSFVTSYAIANSCQGELVAMNAGRGELGVVFGLDEMQKTARADSVAKFSSAAIAYDETTNRTYYVSSPIPLEFKVDISHLDISDEQRPSLPIRGDKYKYSRLAYFDHATGEHVVVGKTKSVFGMAYASDTDSLFAVSFSKLYRIDKYTGEETLLADFSGIDGLSRADLVIKNGDLLLVTATSVYSIDRNDYSYTKLANHNLVNVTGATLSQKGDVLISRVIINDHGDQNESKIYKLSPYSGKTCLVATLPIHISDLTTNTSSSTSCYTEAPCAISNDGIPYYSETVNNQLGGEWQSFDFQDQYFTKPAVFTSAATVHDENGGVIRLNNIETNGSEISFQNWQYLNTKHDETESFDFLTMNEGRYTMSDGTIVEIGSFSLSNTRKFKDVVFSKAFSSKPYVFLQTQTFNGPHSAYTRAGSLSTSGFKAAFYEQESLNEGHWGERVAYFAILPGSGTSGTLETVAGNKHYKLYQADIDHDGGQIGKHFYFLQEEQSMDEELLHAKERVHVMDIEEVSLAQTVTVRGEDTYTLRRK